MLNDEYDVEMFDNVWVLIGATAFSLDDVVPTPYSGSAPGVELQARMLGSILDNKVPYVPQGNREISALLSAIFGGVLFLLSLYRGRYAIVGIPLFSIMAPVISFSCIAGPCSSLIYFWDGWVQLYLQSLVVQCWFFLS